MEHSCKHDQTMVDRRKNSKIKPIFDITCKEELTDGRGCCESSCCLNGCTLSNGLNCHRIFESIFN